MATLTPAVLRVQDMHPAYVKWLEHGAPSWCRPKLDRLICGKHRRLIDTEEPPKHTRRGGRKHRVYFRNFFRGEGPGSCICDYEPFPELLLERFFARGFIPDGTFGLLKLPVELRLDIFELLLLASEPIEVCPEPFEFGGRAPAGRVAREIFDEEREVLNDYHTSVLKGLRTSAKLLRTSKQIRDESAPILYGRNEFRFTNSSGWIGLDGFQQRIGINNCRRLRHVTVCHPSFTILPETLLGAAHFEKGILHDFVPKHAPPYYIYPSRWFDLRLTSNPIIVMERFSNLRYLHLVVPWVQTMKDESRNALLVPLLDEMVRPDTKITFVSVRNKNAKGRALSSLAEIIATAHNNQISATGQGDAWNAATAEFDKMGRYRIELKFPTAPAQEAEEGKEDKHGEEGEEGGSA